MTKRELDQVAGLKACPFCGRDIYLRTIEVSGWEVVQCHWCLATGPYGLLGKDGRKDKPWPIDAWNTRAS